MIEVIDTYIPLVNQFLTDPLDYVSFGDIQHHENVTVIPLLVDHSIKFITVNKAQQQGSVEISETGKVGSLNVENKGSDLVLIPFGVTVKGGRQDRTVYEPVLLPKGVDTPIDTPIHKMVSVPKRKPLFTIPTRCIEQSRWSGATPTFRAVAKASPMVAYHAHSKGNQSAVWAGITALKQGGNISHTAAPTSNYNDVMKVKRGDINKMLSHFPMVDGQCGVVVFINNELIGLEFYGNVDAWKDMHEQVVRAFLLESLYKSPNTEMVSESVYQDKIVEEIPRLMVELAERDGRGMGKVVEITTPDQTWRGVALVYLSTFVQFYLVRRSFVNVQQTNVIGGQVRTRRRRDIWKTPVDLDSFPIKNPLQPLKKTRDPLKKVGDPLFWKKRPKKMWKTYPTW